MQCPQRYFLNSADECIHYIWPLSLKYIIGIIILVVANGLATIAGLGGGGVALVIFLLFFDYTAKDATIVVLCSIFGAATGNISNLMTKAFNGNPLIQYHYVFLIIPIMFSGAFIGILINKYFPSAVICLIILIVILSSTKKTYIRFKTNYEKQTQQILLHEGRQSDIINEEKINPFDDQRNMYIIKNIAVIILIAITLSMIRGSQKFPSIIGILPCSTTFWIFYVLSFFIMGLIAYRNLQIVKGWMAPQPIQKGQQIKEHQNSVQSNIGSIVLNSIGAGILSGFGLGGGIILVPALRSTGLSPLQATSTCSLCIFITSFINCMQGIFIGVISPIQFVFYVCFLGVSGYITSKVLSGYLRRKNRLSFAEGALLFLIVVALINIPFSLYLKYKNSGYDESVIFGFGSLC